MSLELYFLKELYFKIVADIERGEEGSESLYQNQYRPPELIIHQDKLSVFLHCEAVFLHHLPR